MRVSISFLGLLFLLAQTSSLTTAVADAIDENNTNPTVAAAALRGRHGGRRRAANVINPLESTLRKLGKDIRDHQQKNMQAAAAESTHNNNHFARRLVAEQRNKYQRLLVDSNAMDSMKKEVFHLTAAQQEDTDNMPVVVMHLKSAIAKMNSVMSNSQQQHGGPATFQESVMGLAKGARDGDSQSFFLHRANVQHGLQKAIGKLHAALEQISTTQELQDFGRQLVVARSENEAKMESLLVDDHDLVATATIVTNALDRFLDDTTNNSVGDGTTTAQQQLELVKNLLALIWILPVSMVAGTFFWAFAGIWEYRGEFSLFQIWLLEILWVMDNIACAIGNESVCLTDGLF